MANNLFVAYDLNRPGQNYDALIAKIKTFGGWAKVQKSLWYVNTNFTADHVKQELLQFVDTNDNIIVIDTKNNSASWRGLSSEVATYIKDNWVR